MKANDAGGLVSNLQRSCKTSCARNWAIEVLFFFFYHEANQILEEKPRDVESPSLEMLKP